MQFSLTAVSSFPCSVKYHLFLLFIFQINSKKMGLIRIELMTPSLSEKCSNRLSYSPKTIYK